jgi:hypothetical protein
VENLEHQLATDDMDGVVAYPDDEIDLGAPNHDKKD